ncbi:MAG: hypothetical protein H7288_25925 [Kineosporiaceae bacterium]|nr:hypothetical protein [Aeromicrobium sp.]
MNKSHSPLVFMAVTVAITGLALSGCSAKDFTSTGATKSSSTASASPSKTAEAPADLTGEWKQSNSKSSDSYQAATITANSIEVNWVTDSGSTTSLYWAGAYVAPTNPGAFSWDSQNDTSKTDGAMLASPAPTKTFSYDNGVISYKVSALGTTTTVNLSRR